jgi:predicted transcriptional regulator
MLSRPMIEASNSQIGNLLQFLAWVADRPRTYAETMEAWRTSCPRLSAWEDATTDGLVDIRRGKDAADGEVVVVLTEKGASLLKAGQESLTSETTNNRPF